MPAPNSRYVSFPWRCFYFS